MNNTLKVLLGFLGPIAVAGCTSTTIVDGVAYQETGELVSLEYMFANSGVYACYDRDRKKRFVINTDQIMNVETADDRVVTFEIPAGSNRTELYAAYQFRSFYGSFATITCKAMEAQA